MAMGIGHGSFYLVPHSWQRRLAECFFVGTSATFDSAFDVSAFEGYDNRAATLLHEITYQPEWLARGKCRAADGFRNETIGLKEFFYGGDEGLLLGCRRLADA